MHISDLPDNPFWMLLAGSDHIVGMIVFGLVAFAVVTLWRGESPNTPISAIMALAVLYIYALIELANPFSTTLALFGLPLAGLFMVVVAVILTLVVMAAAEGRRLSELVVSGFLLLSTVAMAFELFISVATSVVFDLANLFWWLAFLVFVCGGAVIFAQRVTVPETESRGHHHPSW